jgi:hypothetical protein
MQVTKISNEETLFKLLPDPYTFEGNTFSLKFTGEEGMAGSFHFKIGVRGLDFQTRGGFELIFRKIQIGESIE